MPAIDFMTLLSIISILAAIFFGYKAYIRSNDNETEERATTNAMMMVKLDDISEDVKDIKRDNQDLRKSMNKLSDRVLIVEQKLDINTRID